MNWDAVGAVAQGLGSIAVFITLAYLAVQTRYNKRELQRSINQSRAEGVTRLLIDIANNPRMHEALLTISKNWGESTPPLINTMVERGKVGETDARMLNSYELASWQLRAQAIMYIDELPAGARAAFDATCRAQYAPETWRGFWYQSSKPALNPDAVRYVDKLLAQRPT